MIKGISLHIGLNYVDPNHYSDWDGKLTAAEFDANDMCSITKSQGFQSTKLLRQQATRSAVSSAIKDAATSLVANDLFVISYSGHGGQLPDLNNEEDDFKDETWCLFDGQMVDDELYKFWSTFKKGVRILVISDSCHSGSVIKAMKNLKKSKLIPKYMPREFALKTYLKNKEFYDGILKAENVDSANIQASVKLISGCQDDQYSYDGEKNGEFTGILKIIWDEGKFIGNYLSFYDQIINAMKGSPQTPNYYNIGQSNEPFDNQKPFTI